MKGFSVGKKKRRARPKAKRLNSSTTKIPEKTAEKKQNPFDLVLSKGKKNSTSSGSRKTSNIVDRRIGQRDTKLTENAKTEKRFLFQQRKLNERKAAEIEASINSSQNQPQISGSGIQRVHWKELREDERDAEESLDDADDSYQGMANKRSKKESIAQLVAHDRQMRAIKAMLNDEQADKTERLDDRFREIKQHGQFCQDRTSHKEEVKNNEKQFVDAYDSLFRELQFQPVPTRTPKIFLPNEVSNSEKMDPEPVDVPSDNDRESNDERNEKNSTSRQKNAAKEREKKWAKRAKNERRSTIKQLRREAKIAAALCAERRRKIRRERDEKTKKILQSLEVQESEYKKLRAISGKR